MSFSFAWVDASETTFLPEHVREDEEVFALQITQGEGDFARLSIDIVNPRMGLLNAGREVWAWVAYVEGVTTTPLFFGRLIGAPQDMTANVVRLDFIARPLDFDAQKVALAETLKTAPYWDVIWINEDQRSNPDAVLEARTKLWHTDRISHVLTASDILTGEDGTLTLTEDEIFAASVNYDTPPGRRVELTAEVSWTQLGAGSIDATAYFIQQYQAASGPSYSGMISSYTGDGLMKDWPKSGQNIGSGWSFGTSTLERIDNKISGPQSLLTPPMRLFVPTNTSLLNYPEWTFAPVMTLDYDCARERREILTFAMELDVQALVTEEGDEEPILVSLASSDVDQPIDAGDLAPIRDVRRNQYFNTDRGVQSVEYCIAVARAKLLARSRAVNVGCETTWSNGLLLTLRKNAIVVDPRIPGGQAAGKIISYTLTANGEGVKSASFTIGCCIGHGGTVTAVAGTADYVDASYVVVGYQPYAGVVVMPIAGEVTYDSYLSIPATDDGLDLFNMTPANSFVAIGVAGGKVEQAGIIAAASFWLDAAQVATALNANKTTVCIQLKPLKTATPFVTEYPLTVSLLQAPKYIDLEAA